MVFGPWNPVIGVLGPLRIGNAGAAPSVKPAKSIDVAKYQPPAKVTVRVAAPYDYRQLFRDTWDTAPSVVTELAQCQSGPVAAFRRGQCNWGHRQRYSPLSCSPQGAPSARAPRS